MRSVQILACAIAVSISMISCKKDMIEMENTWPHHIASNGALANLIAQHAPPIQQFVIDASVGATVTGVRGCKITFRPNAFVDQGNNLVNGSVTVYLQEVLNKTDIIYSGGYTTANGLPLVSGGEINIKATQGVNELRLAGPNAAIASIPVTGDPVPMKKFTAREISMGSDFSMADTFSLAMFLDTSSFVGTQLYYGLGLDSLDWTNCDQYMSMPNPTRFSVSVPVIFDNQNTMVFVTSDFSNYVSRIWDYDAVVHVYNCNYYRLPVGEQFTFTAISEINGQFYYASRTVTITEDIAVSLVPQVCTEAEVLQNISNL